MDLKQSVKQAANTLGIKSKLKKIQSKAINDGLDGHDLLVIAPTSFGKSAIFQVIALVKKGLTIIVVPTLSLLHDQVEQLQQSDISVGFCSSDVLSWNESDMQSALDQYGYLLLYTTPESLWKLDLSDIPVSLLVVDECHCVTSWGYGFRKAYLEIGDFVDSLFHRPQVIALTATAPIEAREQIKQLLHMKHVSEHTVSLYRPKLTFSSYSFVSEEARQKKLKHLLKRHMKSGDGSCIIYCNTKKHADTIYDLIKARYPDQVAICHSNLPNKERKRNEKAFMRGERHIMVSQAGALCVRLHQGDSAHGPGEDLAGPGEAGTDSCGRRGDPEHHTGRDQAVRTLCSGERLRGLVSQPPGRSPLHTLCQPGGAAVSAGTEEHRGLPGLLRGGDRRHAGRRLEHG